MELDNVVKTLNKKFKIGNIQLGVEFQEVDRIPFSSPRLNYMTYGGIPIGRIIEFYGDDGSGKTTTALDLAGQAQRLFPAKKVLFVDYEHTFDPVWATKLGVDVANIMYFDPDAMGAEDVFNAILEIMETGGISLCVLDSIGSMVSMQANEKQIGERTYGGISMPLTEFSKKLTPILAKTLSTFIGINQLRDNMESAYGGAKTTGGRAFRHACSMRLEFRKGVFIDEKGNALTRGCENPAGNQVNVNLIKSKVCRPDRKVGYYTLNYLTGIDYVMDTFDVAVKLGVIYQSGAWYSVVDSDTGEIVEHNGETWKFQGKPKFLEAMSPDSELFDYVNEQVSELQK
jgi:recombination protein RecA